MGMKYWEGNQGSLGQALAVGAMLQPFWSCVPAGRLRGCCALGQQARAAAPGRVAPGGSLSLHGVFMRLKEAKVSPGGQMLYTHNPTGAFEAGEDEAKA